MLGFVSFDMFISPSLCLVRYVISPTLSPSLSVSLPVAGPSGAVGVGNHCHSLHVAPREVLTATQQTVNPPPFYPNHSPLSLQTWRGLPQLCRGHEVCHSREDLSSSAGHRWPVRKPHRMPSPSSPLCCCRYVVNIFLTITQFGFCAVYFVFMGASLNRVSLHFLPFNKNLLSPPSLSISICLSVRWLVVYFRLSCPPRKA